MRILQRKWCFETRPNRVEIPEDTGEPCPWVITFTLCHGELHGTIHNKTRESPCTLHHMKSFQLLIPFLLFPPSFRMNRCISFSAYLFSTLLFFSFSFSLKNRVFPPEVERGKRKDNLFFQSMPICSTEPGAGQN